MTAQYMDFDAGLERCEGCGRITANQWLLCNTCTDAENDDDSYQRPFRVVDPVSFQ